MTEQAPGVQTSGPPTQMCSSHVQPVCMQTPQSSDPPHSSPICPQYVPPSGVQLTEPQPPPAVPSGPPSTPIVPPVPPVTGIVPPVPPVLLPPFPVPPLPSPRFSPWGAPPALQPAIAERVAPTRKPAASQVRNLVLFDIVSALTRCARPVVRGAGRPEDKPRHGSMHGGAPPITALNE